MAETLRILSQISPSANVLTDLYTVAVGKTCAVSSITICNCNGSSDITFSISLAVGGAVDEVKQYLYFDLPMENNDTFIATIGVTLGATDVIRVKSSLSNVSFQCFGIEVT